MDDAEHTYTLEHRLAFAQRNAATLRRELADVADTAARLQAEEERLRAFLCAMLNVCEVGLSEGKDSLVLPLEGLHHHITRVLRGPEQEGTGATDEL